MIPSTGVPDEVPTSLIDLVGTDWNPDGRARWLTPSHWVYSAGDGVPAERVVADATALDPQRWSTLVALGQWIAQPLLEGLPAHQPERHGEIGGLAELAGQELRRIHSLDSPDVAISGWEALAARVRASSVDTTLLAEPFRRYELDRLIELWRDGRPAGDDLVVCHGQPRLEHLVVANGVVSGWSEPRHVIIADRHLDLAIAHRSIHANLGADAVFRFYEAYGQDPTLPTIEHYLLADLLIP